VRLPILRGVLRGRWWLAASRGKILRVVTGSYEPAQTRLMESAVPRGGTVLDVGAHTGYYTVLASALAGAAGRVHAFEPQPRNARFLRRHVAINGCANTVVEELAVSARSGTAFFGAGSGSGTGRLRPDGPLEVRTVSLDDYCDRHHLAPDVIKVDVEGAEADVLRGAERVLRRDRPVVLLSTHGKAAHEESLAMLADLGYGAEGVGGGFVGESDELVCRPVLDPTIDRG
jgi:FkbM family methyltransferase